MSASVRVGALGVVASLVVVACAPLSIAVENRDDVPYVLRVVDERHRAWLVPPKSSGVGPIDEPVRDGFRFIIVTTLDCAIEVTRIGLSSEAHTLIVEDAGLQGRPLDGIAPGLPTFEQIADPCE